MKFEALKIVIQHRGSDVSKPIMNDLVDIAIFSKELLLCYEKIRLKNKMIDPKAREPKYLGPWKDLSKAIKRLEKRKFYEQ